MATTTKASAQPKAAAPEKPKKPRNALVLGGGAPNFTLMTGALLAFEERGYRFDVVTASGGGGGVALNYVAPQGFDSRIDALKNSVNYGVSDAIYKILPMNYKVFMKGSKVADAYRWMLSKIPGYNLVMNQYNMTNREKLVSDLVQALWAATTPTTVNFFSKGICAHAPFIRQMVDFEKLKTVEEEVFICAYNLTDHRMRTFSKEEINFTTFGASLSYPFVYPPTEIDGKYYIEGASVDAFNIEGLLEYAKTTPGKLDNIVLLNAFGNEGYLQVPPNLWQAWGQSIITPLISLDQTELELIKIYHAEWNQENPDYQNNLLVHDFEIPPGWNPTALDWSSSNLHRLFTMGYEQGNAFIDKYGWMLKGDPKPTETELQKKAERIDKFMERQPKRRRA